ncbi:MAG: NlpC/P60 family protein, partial [Coriobacteriia bacterium]|nr:NlpC/P60 family protein [Coriobacteriia bacterium]
TAAIGMVLCATCAAGLGMTYQAVIPQEASASSTKALIKSKQEQANQVRKQLEELGAQADATNDKIYELEVQLADTEAKISEIETLIDEKQAELQRVQEQLAKRVSASYKAGNTSFLGVLVGANDFDDFISRMHYAQSIANSDAEMIKVAKELKQQLEDAHVSLDQRKQEQADLIAQNKEKVALLQSYMDESNKILESLDAEIAQLIQKQRAEEEAAAIAAAQARLQAEAQAALKAREEAQAQAAQAAQLEAQAKKAQEEALASGDLEAQQRAQAALEEAQKKQQSANQQVQDADGQVKNVENKVGGSSDIVSIARGFTGYDYRAPYPGVYGGLDCSGLVTAVYNKKGISLPRSSAGMYSASKSEGWAVSQDQLQPGDLIFYKQKGASNVGHVAIYSGNGKAIQAYNPGRPSGEGSMTMSNWDIVGYGRPGK